MPDNEGVPIELVSTSVARTTMDRGYAKAVDPYMFTSTSEKLRLTQVDPELGAQKRQRRTGNLAEGVTQTTTSFPRLHTQATSPDTGIDPHDDVALKASPRETGDSLARRVTQEGAEISPGAFDALKHEVQLLRESSLSTGAFGALKHEV